MPQSVETYAKRDINASTHVSLSACGSLPTSESAAWTPTGSSFAPWPAGQAYCGELKILYPKQGATSSTDLVKPKITIAADARMEGSQQAGHRRNLHTAQPRSTSLPMNLPPRDPGTGQQFLDHYAGRSWHARDLADPRPFLWPSRAPPPPPSQRLISQAVNPTSPAAEMVHIAGGRQSVRRAVSLPPMRRGQVLRPHRPPPSLPSWKGPYNTGNPFADENGCQPPPSQLPFKATAVDTLRFSPVRMRPAQLPNIPEDAALPEVSQPAWALSSALPETYNAIEEPHPEVAQHSSPTGLVSAKHAEAYGSAPAAMGAGLPDIKIVSKAGARPLIVKIQACTGNCDSGEFCGRGSPDRMTDKQGPSWGASVSPGSSTSRDGSPSSKWRKAARFFLSLA